MSGWKKDKKETDLSLNLKNLLNSLKLVLEEEKKRHIKKLEELKNIMEHKKT